MNYEQLRRSFSWALAMALMVAGPQALPQERSARGPDSPPPSVSPPGVDLTGYWGEGFGGFGGGFFGGGPGGAPPDPNVIKQVFPVRKGQIQNLTNDNTLRQRADDDVPLYKPQYWAKVQDLDFRGNQEDPSIHCKSPGVPRLGPPSRIIQTPFDVILFYPGGFSHHDFRIVPTDGRKHNAENLLDGSWNGDAIGTWEGDTLVVETLGLIEESWLGAPGYFHSENLKVVERFRRQGTSLDYTVTVEDPTVLMQPWVTHRTLRALPPQAGNALAETPPCSERDSAHIVGPQREG